MQNIEIDIDRQGVALLALNRPEVLNALSLPLLEELCQALRTLAEDEKVRALVLTGRGRGFCAGADLSTVGQGGPAGETVGQTVSARMQSHYNPAMELLYHFPRPTVCAINGIAAGGGAAIALCADIVLASRKASLKVVQVQALGIVADLGANWLLQRIAGRSRAMGACLLGGSLKPEQLLEWGLVWECVDPDQLLSRALEIGGQLAAVPAAAVLATRQLVDAAGDTSFSEALEQERQAQRELCDQPVFAESAARFLSKQG